MTLGLSGVRTGWPLYPDGMSMHATVATRATSRRTTAPRRRVLGGGPTAIGGRPPRRNVMDCPQDDTCDCENVKALEAALKAAKEVLK